MSLPTKGGWSASSSHGWKPTRHWQFIRDIDIAGSIERWLDHMAAAGLCRERARRLLYEYGPSRGLINDLVAEALCRDHAVDVPENAVVVTVGAQEAMLLTLRVLFGSPGDRLAVANPCFPGILGGGSRAHPRRHRRASRHPALRQ